MLNGSTDAGDGWRGNRADDGGRDQGPSEIYDLGLGLSLPNLSTAELG